MFGTMNFFGALRISQEDEIAGMDRIKHGEPAYPLTSYEDPGRPHTFDKHLPGILTYSYTHRSAGGRRR